VDERRSHLRYSIAGTVEVEIGPNRYSGALENISLGGLEFSPGVSPPVGETGVVRLSLPEFPEIRAECRIIRVNKGRVGLTFSARPEGLEQVIPTPPNPRQNKSTPGQSPPGS
jgi:hypothetical protein